MPLQDDAALWVPCLRLAVSGASVCLFCILVLLLVSVLYCFGRVWALVFARCVIVGACVCCLCLHVGPTSWGCSPFVKTVNGRCRIELFEANKHVLSRELQEKHPDFVRWLEEALYDQAKSKVRPNVVAVGLGLRC